MKIAVKTIEGGSAGEIDLAQFVDDGRKLLVVDGEPRIGARLFERGPIGGKLPLRRCDRFDGAVQLVKRRLRVAEGRRNGAAHRANFRQRGEECFLLNHATPRQNGFRPSFSAAKARRPRS